MKSPIRLLPENGFSLVEMMVSILILSVIIGAVVNLFSVAINQHESEQTSIESNQDARSGFEIMTQEIAQAGNHADQHTTTTASITAQTSAQAVTVASSTGFLAGDYVDVDNGAGNETVKLTAVANGSLSGIFRTGHATAGTIIRLLALPFKTGVVPPAGLAANSSTTVTTLQFYGDINSDGTINYVEYVYDNANGQITRSITPITQGTINAALPLIRNVKANSAGFTLFTDSQTIVTAVRVDVTVQNTWRTGNKNEETHLSTRVLIPSAVAASALATELQTFGGIDEFPPTPAQVAAWVNR